MKIRDDNIIGRQSGYHKSTGSVWGLGLIMRKIWPLSSGSA